MRVAEYADLYNKKRKFCRYLYVCPQITLKNVGVDVLGDPFDEKLLQTDRPMTYTYNKEIL